MSSAQRKDVYKRQGYNGLGPDAAHCALERKLGYRSLDHQDDYISNADLLGGIGGLKAGDVELAVGIAKDHAVPGHLVHVGLVGVNEPNFLGPEMCIRDRS